MKKRKLKVVDTCPNCNSNWMLYGKKKVMLDGQKMRQMFKEGATHKQIAAFFAVPIRIIKKEISFNGDGGLE